MKLPSHYSNMALIFESASLMALPREIRLEIFSYLLPSPKLVTVRVERSNICDHYPYHFTWQAFFCAGDEEKPPHHLEIALANQQCYLEASQLLYNGTLRLEIDERAFWACSISKSYGPLIDDEAYTWDDVVPGLDFSKFRELRIVIHPCNLPGYWMCLEKLMRNFCRSRLAFTTSSGKLRVDLHDMSIGRNLKDYAGALEPLGDLARRVKECEIHLPVVEDVEPGEEGWRDHALFRRWAQGLGRRLVFDLEVGWAWTGFWKT